MRVFFCIHVFLNPCLYIKFCISIFGDTQPFLAKLSSLSMVTANAYCLPLLGVSLPHNWSAWSSSSKLNNVKGHLSRVRTMKDSRFDRPWKRVLLILILPKSLEIFWEFFPVYFRCKKIIFSKKLALSAQTPQNGQTHSNNLSAVCQQIIWVCLTILILAIK